MFGAAYPITCNRSSSKGAKSELETLRLAAVQNESGLQRNTDADMEFVLFSDEMNCRSLEAAMNSVIPNWINRLGGPIAGLWNQGNGEVVNTRACLQTQWWELN